MNLLQENINDDYSESEAERGNINSTQILKPDSSDNETLNNKVNKLAQKGSNGKTLSVSEVNPLKGAKSLNEPVHDSRLDDNNSASSINKSR